ncbi:MAG: ABC transporter permease [Lachnospiraceae bacterium]|nr:ABC transporter permease [Lachnospiraceae bacterium]
MLANNNKPIVNKLAKNTIRSNKRQFVILFFTIALSAFLLFSIFTIGLTYLNLSRLQNTRLYGSECDIALINGFTEGQKDLIKKHPKIQSIGTQAYSGHVKSTDADPTVNAGLLWCDETFWEVQKAPARTQMKGDYPQDEHELLATREVLEACGKNDLSVGSHFSMTYEDNTGIHTKEFTISGIWSGYGKDKSNFYVSEDFYNQSGYQLESNGILQIKFKNNYVTGRTIKELEDSLTLSPQQVFQPSDYIERSLTILMAVWGLCLMICLSAYLLIYNILYLSVSGKVRYYGLLQTLGMTKKQLTLLIRRQTFLVGISGMAAGILLALFISLFLTPYILNLLGISFTSEEIQFHPLVLFLSILTTGTAVLWGIQTPLHIAADVTPVEAAKYRLHRLAPCRNRFFRLKKISKTAQLNTPGPKKNLYWSMAKDQLQKDKKKTSVIYLSLAFSLIVFYCLTAIIDSYGKRTVYPNYWNADMILNNNTQTTEDMASLQSAMDDSFLSDLEKIEGIDDFHVLRGFPVIFPYDRYGFSDFWIKGYTSLKPYLSSAKTLLDYQNHPQKYYGMIKGIDEAEFDYLNESLGNPIDKQDFLQGNTAIVQYAGFEIPEEWIGRTVSFTTENLTQDIQIGAVSYESYYGASVNAGPNLVVSEDYLKTIRSEEPDILSLIIKYQQPYSEKTEQEVKSLLKKSPRCSDLSYLSKYDEMKQIQDSQGSMFQIGTVISLLLLSVGMLNYGNTMAGSIQHRRLSFSIMESVGMSGKQIVKLLIREGILYAAGSVFLTLTVGTGITYLVFQSMNYMKIPFAIPVLPLLCAVILVTILCMAVPVITYRKIVGNRPMAERLREYE